MGEVMEPQLNRQEIQAICDDNDAGPSGPDHDGINIAATRKALSWCLQEINEMATHFHELPHPTGSLRAGIEAAAEELQERMRLLGLEP